MSNNESEVRKTPRRTQAERREEAEQRLLEAARQIVARKGWAGMTLAEVGEAAGYSRGLATHHFGNKANLLRALASFVNAEFMRLVDADKHQRHGLQAIEHFVEVYFDRKDGEWVNTRALLALLAEAVTEDSGTVAVLASYNRTVQDHLAAQVRAAIDVGEVPSAVDPLGAAAFILGMLRGTILQYLLDPKAQALSSLHRHCSALMRAALVGGAAPPAG